MMRVFFAVLPCLLGCLLAVSFLSPGLAASPLPFATSEQAAASGTDTVAVSETDQATSWQRLSFWLLQQQRNLHRQLAEQLELLQARPSLNTAGGFLLLSFLYGVFHAAGPGHGKAVMTSYLLTQPTRLKQALLLSVLASMLQAVTAVLLVTLLVQVLNLLAREAFSSVRYVELFSFLLVALLGLALMLRSVLQRMRAGRATEPASYTFVADDAQGMRQAAVLNSAACSQCGKVHHVAPQQLLDVSFWQQVGLLLSIGLRPCSGAVLVLVVANLLNLWWVGVAATLVMAVGTSLTVACLALLAVKARQLAEWSLSSRFHAWSWLVFGLSLLGGLVIFLLGISLFLGSWQTDHPLM